MSAMLIVLALKQLLWANNALSIQFNSNCPTLTAKVTCSKKLLQCRERVGQTKMFSVYAWNV